MNVCIGRALLIVAFMTLTAGCGHGVRVYTSPALKSMTEYKVAVLPFSNLSSEGLAGEVVDFAVLQELMNRDGYQLVSPSRVHDILAELRIRYAERMTTAQVQSLGRRLGADGLLVGAVDTYEYRNVSGEEVATVSLHLRMIETTEGDVVWAADHHRAGNDGETILGFGLVDSLADLAQKVIQEMINTLPEISKTTDRGE